jgi:hypothetical protein
MGQWLGSMGCDARVECCVQLKIAATQFGSSVTVL